ncbi:hypothetical protein KP509_38G056900 [Ceratopteris richardii]|uniref:AB hydrolase-1 domain-containing protein n=2 Tax=Ceratopteris richardii TaxID=49495 RepID=A0A8T2Q587_CERRI|nr:hypothetical protein KP509_38G056900 [Ceratopteris richardii]
MINSQIRNSKIMVFGSGPVVLFVHGFPEGWFGWRKQIPVFAGAGFRTIAPDMRGYGDSSAPEGVNNYTYLHIVGDLIGLLDALGVEKAFVVGHDWGAIIAWQLAIFRPDRVTALANLSVYYIPRNPRGSLVTLMRKSVGDDHYFCKFQLPGEAEARIDQVTYDGFFRHVFSDKFATLLPDWSKAFEEKGPLPEWTSEEDLAYFISEFRKHGLTPAINYYRALDLSWELTAAWTNHKVMVPTIFMIGDHDLVYHFPNAKQDIERMAERVPLLKKITVVEGANHFLQLERADIVNDHILQFFKSF